MEHIKNDIIKKFKESFIIGILGTFIFPFAFYLFEPNTKISIWILFVAIYLLIISIVIIILFVNSWNSIKRENKLVKVNEDTKTKEKLVQVYEWENKYIFTFKAKKGLYNIGMLVTIYFKTENEVEHIVGYGVVENVQFEKNLIQIDIEKFMFPEMFQSLTRNEATSLAKFTMSPHILKKYLESEYQWKKPI